MTARPTTIGLMLRHCPHAITLYERGAPQDRSVYAVGTAAHDVLEHVARHDLGVVDAVTHALMTEGREGVDSEPPLPAEAVLEGRDLALRWISERGITPGTYEVGIAYLVHPDGRWERVEYTDPRATLRTRLDVVGWTHLDDADVDPLGASPMGLVISDYKTSWRDTGTTRLGLDAEGQPVAEPALQQRIQAVLALRAYRDGALGEPVDPVEFVRLQIENLRTLRRESRDLWLDDPDDAEMLARWEHDALELARAAAHTPRQASPGHRCLGCPYLGACEPAREWWAHTDIDPTDPASVAESWVYARGEVKRLQALVEALTDDGRIITLDDGAQVGRLPSTRARPVPDAGWRIWRAWSRDVVVDDATEEAVRGLLTALRPGVTSLRAAAKVLHPRAEMDDRRALLAELLEDTTTSRLEVRRG